MCARYTMRISTNRLAGLFELEEEPVVEYRPHAAPTDTMPVVRMNREGHREMIPMRWGLIPHWAKDSGIARQTFNARSETVFEKPAFRDAVLRRRCLVPADGFIEWKEPEEDVQLLGGLFGELGEPRPKSKRKKTPFHIHLKEHRPFSFAGLYDRWTSPDGAQVRSFTVLTCPPNDLMEQIHNRMPVILREQDYALWLDRQIVDPEMLSPLLNAYDASQMEAVPMD